MLIHTEYTKNEVSRFAIYKDRVKVINGNRPYFNNVIDIDNCEAYTKNPNIAKVFRMLDKTEQIGSGTMKLSKYSEMYGGSKPTLIDERRFKVILPINVFKIMCKSDNNIKYSEDMTKMRPGCDQDATKIIQNNIEVKILDYCKEPKNLDDIMKFVNKKHKFNFRKQYLNPLIQQHKLSMTIPDKPTSKYQKYITIKVEE